jgi:hypothetical protein
MGFISACRINKTICFSQALLCKVSEDEPGHNLVQKKFNSTLLFTNDVLI